MLKTGFSSQIITPKEPVWLGGYLSRNKKSCGIHDDIYAKAFYASDGNTDIVLVSCDMLYLMQENISRIREKVFARYGIKNMTIGVTHDHSSPEIHTYDEQADMAANRDWLDYAEEMICQVTGEAIEKAEPMRLYAGFMQAPGVAKNRRAGETSVDDTLMAIRAEDAYGQTKGIIVDYSCHCTVLDSNNYLITADYPGYIYRKLNEKYNHATVLFFNGACGNINIGYSADASALGEDMGDVRTFENEWHAAILGYANGFLGYLPTKAAHLAGGYECETSIHSVDSEDYLICMMKKSGL